MADAGRTIVVSPHLDDAVLSLGATIARWSREGAPPVVLTVMGGDPQSALPAGTWDAASGFTTLGESIAARRAEDARACGAIGATTAWLPFADLQYAEAPHDELVTALEPALAEAATVLTPGWPMTNTDHERVTRAVLAAVPAGARLGFYLEQPYDWWAAREQRRLRPGTFRQPPPEPCASPAGPWLEWTRLPCRLPDVARKLRAARAYRSQLPHFGRAGVERILLREARRGGEHVAWANG